ncbi:oligosaccharide flippase family protein [Pirellulaceae bacterium SH449]
MSDQRSTLRRIGLNAFSVLGGDVLNKAGIFLVYALLARQAGVLEFGQLSLGLLLLYTFHVFAVAGLPIAMTREVAKRPKSAKRLLHHGYLAALLPAVVSVVFMIGLALLMQYERNTVLIIVLLALAVPAYALTMITEAVIKGRQQMHLIPLGNLPGNIFLVLASFSVLYAGYSVLAVAAVVVASRVITFVFMHQLFLRTTPAERTRWKLRYSWMLLRKSMIFLGSDGVQAIGASLFGLLLSKFGGEEAVGLLGASFQLLQPIQMFYRSLGHSSFPQLVVAARSGHAAVGNLSRSIIELILRFSFPATIALVWLAGDILGLVYGNASFRDGQLALQILAFTLLLDPMNPILGHGLWAMGRDKTVFQIVVINVLTNLIVGFVLISRFDLVGAACSVLVSATVNMVQHCLQFTYKVDRLDLGRILLRLAPAVLASVACLVAFSAIPYLAIVVSLVVYAVIELLRSEFVMSRSPLRPDTPK